MTYACCTYWGQQGAALCVSCDASNAARDGDIWRTSVQVQRADRRCGIDRPSRLNRGER